MIAGTSDLDGAAARVFPVENDREAGIVAVRERKFFRLSFPDVGPRTFSLLRCHVDGSIDQR